jgi:hypothetical protein
MSSHTRSQGLERSVQFTTESDLKGNTSNVSIERIVGGLGITATLKNNGLVDLFDLEVSVNLSKGSYVFLRTTHVNVATLAANASATVHLQLFGMGFGMLNPLPVVTMIVSCAELVLQEVRITFKVLGPLTKIVGVSYIDEVFPGFILFSPEYSKKTFVMDRQGGIVHSWSSQYIQGLGVYLLADATLLRTALPFNNPVFVAGGVTGAVELFDWNGTRLWEFTYSDSQHCLHHDIEVLPNGHVLMVGWEYKTASEAIAAGRVPGSLPIGAIWPDHVIEVERTGVSTGVIVWEWHVWDHLIQDFDPSKENYGVVEQHPELLDINYGIDDGRFRADWNHINSLDYNEEFDQILLSARSQDELWVIDHSTTTLEAAGHSGGKSGKGGDLLYRWGNPRTYGAGVVNDQMLFAQHDAQWISKGCPGEGNILVFNNGAGRPEGQYSSVDELIPPVDDNGSYLLEPGSAFGPEELAWRYTAENHFDFYAGYLSSAQRLPNGNSLLCDGKHGLFFEITAEGKTVWTYQNTAPDPSHDQVFKVICYAPDYPGLRFLTK